MQASLEFVYEHRFSAMGTDAHILLHGGTVQDGLVAERQVRKLEQRWSRFIETSEVSQLNRSQGGLTVVSEDTFCLVKQAVDAWVLTGGLFDPTIEAAMMAAGYRKDYSTLDRTTAVHPVLGVQAAPTPEGIVLDPAINAVGLPPGVTIDLGGIGKGAAADAVALALLANGVAGCIVNLGGDMRISGTPPTASGWPVILQCDGSANALNIQVKSGAVCTSTKSKRVWNSSSGPQHHLRDPSTGTSAATGLRSVSVICARATQGEVLAKAAFLAGKAKARDLLAKHQVTGVLVTDDGHIETLNGLEAFLSA